jgi:hypothetical protein
MKRALSGSGSHVCETKPLFDAVLGRPCETNPISAGNYAHVPGGGGEEKFGQAVNARPVVSGYAENRACFVIEIA